VPSAAAALDGLRVQRQRHGRDRNFNGSVALSVVAGCADVSRSVMIDAVKLAGTVFSGLSALVIEDAEDAGEGICIRARTPAGAVACPGCGTETARVHGYHERTAADVPAGGRRVLVRVTVRKMRCPVPGCPRQTFREQVPGVLDRCQRRTTRLTGQVSAVARELAAGPGRTCCRHRASWSPGIPHCGSPDPWKPAGKPGSPPSPRPSRHSRLPATRCHRCPAGLSWRNSPPTCPLCGTRPPPPPGTASGCCAP
jgi:hypothetical protein